MKKAGYTIKKIRESKNISQVELAEGITSVSNLSKYEREETNTTDVIFFSLLDKMNVSFDEFESLYKSEGHTFHHLFKRCWHAIQEEDMHLLSHLLEELKDLNKQTKNCRYQHYQYWLQSYINQLSHIENDKRYVSKIVTYLSNVEDWGRYEIVLFGNFIPFLSLERVNDLAIRVRKKSHLYQNSKQYLEQVSRVLLNILYQDIEARKIHWAKEVVKELNELLQGTSLFYERLKLNYYSGIMMIIGGNVNKGELLAKKCIDFLYTIGEDGKGREYQKYLNQFLVVK